MNSTSAKPALVPLALLALAASSFGGVLTDTATQSSDGHGNQSYGGTLGDDFDVLSSPLLVTSLGAFDDYFNGFQSGTTVIVSIYDRDTQSIVGGSATFTNASAGTLVGNFREKAITPFQLAAGGHYSIIAEGFNSNDTSYNSGGLGDAATNSAPTLLTFVGTSRYGAAGSYPSGVDGGPAIRYAAGNFSVQAVPEPAPMVALSLGALALVRRRRK